MKANLVFITLCLLCAANLYATPYPEDKCTPETPVECLNGVGPAVTNPDSIRNTAANFSKQINKAANKEDANAVAFTGTSALSGLSAGDGFSGIGIWSSYNNTGYEADLPINSAVRPVASYDANQYSFFAGIDTFIADRAVIGLALSYDNTDIRTAYNGGNNETVGYTFAPYLAYMINDMFSVDAFAGYTSLEYDTDRVDNVSGGTILGSFDADRWFFSSNLNANMIKDNWLINARAGLLYTEEEQDAYLESGPNTARSIADRKVDLAQFSVGLNVARSYGRMEPFAGIAYYYDVTRDDGVGAGGLPANVGATQPDDDDEFQTSLGFRYYGDYVTGSLEWIKVLCRDKFDSDSFLVTFRIDL